MNILDILKQDHEELKSVLNRLEMTTTRASRARQKLTDTLVQTFEAHAQAEEQVYYRRLMNDDDAHELAYEGYEEHKLAKTVLHDVLKTNVSDEAWKPRLKVFKEIVQHHIEEEESEYFEHSRECFSDELEKLGDQFMNKKSKFLEKKKMRAAG